MLRRVGVFIATQLNWTQLNSNDPVEQRTAKSVMFLFTTSWPTTGSLRSLIGDRLLFTLWTRWQFDVELSCVAINTPLEVAGSTTSTLCSSPVSVALKHQTSDSLPLHGAYCSSCQEIQDSSRIYITTVLPSRISCKLILLLKTSLL